MNYVLYHSGKLPDHINDCISNIKDIDKKSNIYLCSDNPSHFNGVISVNSKEVISSQTKELIEKEIYKGTNYESNPLWQTSLIRIFILRDFVGKFELNDIIHFDNDVLVYVEGDNLKNLFSSNQTNITRTKTNVLVFGYSYFKNFQILDNLCNEIYQTILQEIKKDKWKKDPKNEMRLLGEVYKNKTHLFNILDSYPKKNSEYIFDPAGYGQIIGGSHYRPRRLVPKRFYRVGSNDNRKRYLPRGGWLDNSYEITDKFLFDRSKIKFKKNRPTLINKSGEFKIVNLHIHSKELKKYKV